MFCSSNNRCWCRSIIIVVFATLLIRPYFSDVYTVNYLQNRTIPPQLHITVAEEDATNTMPGVRSSVTTNNRVSSVNCAFCAAEAADADTNSTTINEKVLWQYPWDPFMGRLMLRRSRKFVGHVYRFQRFLHKLNRGEPTRILLFGGSNCHAGYCKDKSVHFAESFPAWLNQAFPPKTGNHTLVNLGKGGGGACFATLQLHTQIDQNGNISKESGADLALLEFSINDNSNLGTPNCHVIVTSDMHTKSRMCFEALVRQLFEVSEDLAVVPIELAAEATQFNGVANHADIQAFYDLPVLSFRDAVYAKYRAVVNHTDPNEFPIKETIWKDNEHITDWGHKVILDMLVFMIQTELQEEEALAPDRPPDLWEPRETTRFGNEKTKPILGNTVTAPMSVLNVYWPSAYMTSAEGVCQKLTEEDIGKPANASDPVEHWTLKLMQPDFYKKLSAHKTREQRRRMCDFMPITRTSGFDFFADSKGKLGWISPAVTNQSESIIFEIPVAPLDSRNSTKEYHIWVGYLRSYATVGKFRATVSATGTASLSLVIDSRWERRQSTAEEIEVGTSMGPANVTIATLPSAKGTSNKVKILWVRAVEEMNSSA